jgi:hypothetical protein
MVFFRDSLEGLVGFYGTTASPFALMQTRPPSSEVRWSATALQRVFCPRIALVTEVCVHKRRKMATSLFDRDVVPPLKKNWFFSIEFLTLFP